MAPLFGLIKNLELGKSKIALQLRLVRSYDIPQYQNENEVLTHECIFHDKEDNRIHASIQQSALATMKPILQQGNVYAMMNFVVVQDNLKFRTTICKHKILIFKHTRITQLEDDVFPCKMYNLKRFEDVCSITDFPKFDLFDIMGIIVSSYRPQMKESNGKPTTLMEIVIEDEKQKTLCCSLWGKYANQLNDFLSAEPKEPVCIILKFCRATLFRGEVRISSIYHAIEIVLNENNEDVKEMSDNFIRMNKDRKTSLEFLIAPKARTIDDEINDGEASFKKISELKTAKVGSFWIYGTIYEVKTIMAWTYLACKKCLSKLRKDDDTFLCTKCESFDVSGRMRYRLRVSVIDDSGSASLTVWDRECMQLIGKSAEDLSVEFGGSDMPFEVDLLEDKSCLFKINVKHGETKFMDGAYGVAKINCDEEIIAKYSKIESASELEDGSSSVKFNAASSITTELLNLSDDESLKRSGDEVAPVVMNKRGKRVSIKKEKI